MVRAVTVPYMPSRTPRVRGALVASGGFTLIELLIVITIAAILTSMAGPSFAEMIARFRVQGAASDLFTAVLRARSEAIKQNSDVSVQRNENSWTAGWRVVAGDNLMEAHAALKNVAIEGNVSSVTYQSSGRLAGSRIPKWTISDVRTQIQRCVKVNLSGEVVVTGAACT